MLSLLRELNAVIDHESIPNAITGLRRPGDIPDLKKIMENSGVHAEHVNKVMEDPNNLDRLKEVVELIPYVCELTILAYNEAYMAAYDRSGMDTRVFNIKPSAVVTAATDHWDLGALVYPDLERLGKMKIDGYHVDAWEAARSYTGGKGDLVMFRRHPYAEDATKILTEAVKKKKLQAIAGYVFPVQIIKKFKNNPPRVGKTALLMNPRTDWFSLYAMADFNNRVSDAVKKKLSSKSSKNKKYTARNVCSNEEAIMCMLGATNGKYQLPHRVNEARQYIQRNPNRPITIAIPKGQLKALESDSHPMLDGEQGNTMIQGIAMGARCLSKSTGCEVIFYLS